MRFLGQVIGLGWEDDLGSNKQFPLLSDGEVARWKSFRKTNVASYLGCWKEPKNITIVIKNTQGGQRRRVKEQEE